MAARPSTARLRENASRLLNQYKEKKHCDIILSTMDQQSSGGGLTSRPDDIHCHKSALVLNSHYFDNILEVEIAGDGNKLVTTPLPGNAYGMIVKEKEVRMVKIVLKDINPKSLKPIIDYIYSGNIHLTFDNLSVILKDAEKLKVESLVSECKSFLNQETTPSNCIDLFLCAQKLGRKDLETKARNYFLNNISRVCQMSSGKVKNLPLSMMQELMKSDKLNEHCAEAAFKMLLIWVDFDRTNRSQHLHGLVEPRIGLLSSDFLWRELAGREVVIADHKTLQVVMSTLQFKQLSLSSPTQPSHSSLPSASALSQSNQSNEDTLLVLTYVFEDKGNGVHERFNPVTNKWSRWITKTLGDAFRVAVLGELMAVIGGVTPPVNRTKVDLYNFKTKQWKSGPNMNNVRAFFGCCAVNENSVMVCGGKTLGNEPFSNCEMLKVTPSGSLSWEQLPPMTIKRFCCSDVAINNKVYVVGGEIELNETTTVYASVEEYDVTTKRWRRRSDMNESRTNFGIATHQNMIYVFGGWRDMRILSTCERYDPCSDTWQYICNLPSARDGCTAGLLGNRIHIIGGRHENSSQWSDTTFAYDTEKNAFSEGATLTHAAFRPQCVVVKNKYLCD